MGRARLRNSDEPIATFKIGTQRLQEKARTTKEELGRCHQTRPQADGPDLGRSQGAGE